MFKNVFDLPGMHDVHIFEFSNSPYDAFFYNESIVFKNGNNRISIIDQFQGKRPILLNKEFFNSKRIDLKFMHTIILDSNVVDAIHGYVRGSVNFASGKRNLIRDFLIHVSAINCDYSPLFYIIENLSKSSEERFIETAGDKLASILKLHCMDEDAYIEKEEMRPKKDSLEYYLNLYSADTLEQCGMNWASAICARKEYKELAEITRFSYACLLKMVLIHFTAPRVTANNIISKYYEFEYFVLDELNMLLGRELNLALYYFSNFAGKLVNVQPNMLLVDALKSLNATAWDLFLLRLPEILLAPRKLPEICTSYIATSEKKLFDVGDMFKIDSLFYQSKEAHCVPILHFDTRLFETVIPKDEMEKINARGLWLSINRNSQEIGKPISSKKLSWLIDDLESQMKYLCR